MKVPAQFSWEEIHDCPTGKGVYAWYCRLTLSRFDIDEAIESITAAVDAGDRESAAIRAAHFLERRIFSFFEQDEYHAAISGPLLPTFAGALKHSQASSKSLVERIVSDPQRLRDLAVELAVATPLFSSPLYIGKSDDLRVRLMSHKRMIQKIRAMPVEMYAAPDSDDSSFAKRVVARGIPPEKLFVCCIETCAERDVHVDVENVLNRVFFPILGRN